MQPICMLMLNGWSWIDASVHQTQGNSTYLLKISLGTAGGKIVVPGIRIGSFILIVFGSVWLNTSNT